MQPSSLWSINIKDVLGGLLMAIFVGVIMYLHALTSVLQINLLALSNAMFNSGIAYLAVMFVQDEQGNFFTSTNPSATISSAPVA